jgi:polyvinyl alcohol dehydrogenase (cytochrome)
MVFTAMKSELFHVVLGVVIWIALTLPDARAQNEAKDWPTYNHDVIGTRHNPDETGISKSNAGRLEEKWRFPAKSSNLEIGVIHATPIVVDGCVYFGTATDPAFYKLAPDGTLRWSYRNPAFTNPAYGKKRAPSLAQLAQAPLMARFLATINGVLSSALVTHDTVFFDDTGGWIYALDRVARNVGR